MPARGALRIHVQDFGGHAFPMQLSRGLAARGHSVSHTYAAQYTTGRGRLQKEAEDPAELSIRAISVAVPFEKYSPTKRLKFELAYGKALNQLLTDEQPDVLISTNLPLFVSGTLTSHVRKTKLPWVYWHQDIVSLAVGDEAARRLPSPAVRVARRYVERIERQALVHASAVVPIGSPFLDQYERWGLRLPRVTVIPNWAPLDDIYPCPRENAWSKEQELPHDVLRLVYAGTLGRKHNPGLLIELVHRLREIEQPVELLVVSEGEGADQVASEARNLTGVRVLPFQPISRLPEVLSSADVLVTLLEPEASVFSIPSKVLTYLAAGRPVLGFVPRSNPSADDIGIAGGLVTSPDAPGVAEAVSWLKTLAADPELVAALGRKSRTLAEQKFDIDTIVDSFVAVASSVVKR